RISERRLDRFRQRRLRAFRTGQPEGRGRARQPCQMPFQPDEAGLRVPAQGLDQREIHWSPTAKRAFSRHSSYSASAVESKTMPPPTLKTASPPGKSEIVRIATLNCMVSSGAITPIAPQ